LYPNTLSISAIVKMVAALSFCPENFGIFYTIKSICVFMEIPLKNRTVSS